MSGELKLLLWIAALMAASFASVAVNHLTGWQVGIGFGVACGMLHARLWPALFGLKSEDRPDA